jgi:hypothetical protein
MTPEDDPPTDAERIAAAIHAHRFDRNHADYTGPDTFYAGMIYAERIARDTQPGSGEQGM